MKFKFYVSIVEIFYPMAILMRVVVPPQKENEYGQLGNVILFFLFPALAVPLSLFTVSSCAHSSFCQGCLALYSNSGSGDGGGCCWECRTWFYMCMTFVNNRMISNIYVRSAKSFGFWLNFFSLSMLRSNNYLMLITTLFILFMLYVCLCSITHIFHCFCCCCCCCWTIIISTGWIPLRVR